jgi:hypothetical protein
VSNNLLLEFILKNRFHNKLPKKFIQFAMLLTIERETAIHQIGELRSIALKRQPHCNKTICL